MESIDGYHHCGESQRSFAEFFPWRRDRKRLHPFLCMRDWCRSRWYCLPVPEFERPAKPKVSDRQLKLRKIGQSKVYFIQESGSMAIKIGTAKDVDGRVRDMSVSTPHLLTVLAVIDGDRDVERVLHRRFAHARIRGEWFHPVPELLAYISEVKAA